MTQVIEARYFNQKAVQVRTQVSAVLTKWGLLARFKRWRLTQDPETGMIVLFGVLNNKYFATHTSIPFGDYFDPRLLQDLESELQMQVVFCHSDGLRYAFICSPGHHAAAIGYGAYPGQRPPQLIGQKGRQVPGLVNLV
jgi:hypothetical protein